jgi:hypothetical protein
MTRYNQALTEQLVHYNSQGLIPGPGEEMSTFIARAELCLRLKEHPPDEAALYTDSWSDDPAMATEAWDLTKRLYDIAPTWVPLAFLNHGLRPWHGGCTWIFTLSAISTPTALIQLRRAFKDSSTYLKLYRRHELIAHEAAHIGRMAFEEAKFEELIAYRSSHSRWQRWLGPLFQSSNEVVLLLLTMAAMLTATWLQVPLLWTLALPATLAAFTGGRLLLRHYQWQRCYARLQTLLGANANAVIYRLTDSEVIAFGSWDTAAIYTHACQQADVSLRWQTIWWAYFQSCEKKQ